MDPFLGQLLIAGFNFAPRGWALAQGQLMSISQNTALFSLLGTNFGGNGVSTFGLPNLQGAITNGQGSGPGLQSYDMGETGGSPTVTLLASNCPTHNHTAQATVGRGLTPVTNPVGQVFAEAPGGINLYSSNGALNSQLNQSTLPPSGNNLPHNNLMPYVCLNWIIALQGVFPARG